MLDAFKNLSTEIYDWSDELITWVNQNNLERHSYQTTQVVWKFKDKNTCDWDMNICKTIEYAYVIWCLQNNSV